MMGDAAETANIDPTEGKPSNIVYGPANPCDRPGGVPGGSNAQRAQQNDTHASDQNCNRNRIIIEPVCP
jgi:hypothetical protein